MAARKNAKKAAPEVTVEEVVADAERMGPPPEFLELMRAREEKMRKEQEEELARFERAVAAQERLATAQERLAAAITSFVESRGGPVPYREETPPRHAEPPLTRAEPAKPAPKESKGPTLEDAQRSVLAFLNAHGPYETGKRLASIGVTKLSAITGSESEKLAKYAAVIDATKE